MKSISQQKPIDRNQTIENIALELGIKPKEILNCLICEPFSKATFSFIPQDVKYQEIVSLPEMSRKCANDLLTLADYLEEHIFRILRSYMLDANINTNNPNLFKLPQGMRELANYLRVSEYNAHMRKVFGHSFNDMFFAKKGRPSRTQLRDARIVKLVRLIKKRTKKEHFQLVADIYNSKFNTELIDDDIKKAFYHNNEMMMAMHKKIVALSKESAKENWPKLKPGKAVKGSWISFERLPSKSKTAH